MADTPLSRWLREEMPRRGYPLEGPRAGGISRLADEAGISRAAMSRIVNGQGEPTPDSLRRIGKVLGRSLGEMMVIAGIAEPGEMVEPVARVSGVSLETSQRPPLDVITNPEYEPTIEELVGGFRDGEEAAIAAIEKAPAEYRLKAILMRRRVREALAETEPNEAGDVKRHAT